MSLGTTLAVSFCILLVITATRLLVLDYHRLQNGRQKAHDFSRRDHSLS